MLKLAVALVAILFGTLSGAAHASTYNVSAADCGNTINQTGPGAISLPATTGMPSACLIAVCNSSPNQAGQHALSLVGFPASLQPRLYMTQCIVVKNLSGTWAQLSDPGRFRPNYYPQLYVDNAGSDANDGLVSNASGNALKTTQACANILQNEYDLGTYQPTCSFTGGQTFGPVSIVGPLTGSSVINFGGNGGQATIQAASGGGMAMFLGDYAPYIISTNITFDCTGGSASCFSIFLHQQSGVDLNNGTILKGAGAGNVGLSCDSYGKTNISSDGISPITLQGTMSQGFAGGLGCMFQVDHGITLAPSTTIAASLVSLAGNASFQYTGALTAGSGVSLAEFFTLRSGATVCASGLTVSGTFSGARQFSVLNNAVLVNASSVSLPGSAGLSSFTGYAPGFAPDGSGGNTGVNAPGC